MKKDSPDKTLQCKSLAVYIMCETVQLPCSWSVLLITLYIDSAILLIMGGALAWWLGRRIPEQEVGGSILTQVTMLCPWARHIYLPKVLLMPREQWRHPNMTEKNWDVKNQINQPTF